MKPVDGAVPSPNIWEHPEVYEVENRVVEADGALAAALESVADVTGRDVLDLGCGTGYHLPWFAERARHVIGVEPHPALARLAARRTRDHDNVTVLTGAAQRIPLPDASVEVVHARWAYFFGPGCEPGLAELDRVVRRGGIACIIDNDASRSTFGAWFRMGYPWLDPPHVIERFWATRGWTRVPVDVTWRFDSRADLESVVRIEFAPDAADRILAGHEGTEVDYAVNLWWRRY